MCGEHQPSQHMTFSLLSVLTHPSDKVFSQYVEESRRPRLPGHRTDLGGRSEHLLDPPLTGTPGYS